MISWQSSAKIKIKCETEHAAMEDVPNTIAVLALVAKNYTQLVHVVTKSCSPRHIDVKYIDCAVLPLALSYQSLRTPLRCWTLA